MEEDVSPADINIDEEMKGQMSLDLSTSPSLDSNTLQSLQEAEKLVEEAERTIVEARWTVCLNETSLENMPIIDLDEEIMEIRYIVAAKFDEANGKRVKNTKSSIPEKIPSRKRDLRSQGKCVHAKVPESRNLKDLPRKTWKMTKEENSLRNIKIQSGPKIDIRNKMSLSKIEAIEIPPSAAVSEKNNGKLFQLRHETCKRGWINDRDSLIDACVQTSLRDSFTSAEPVQDALSRSHGSDLDQNKIHQLNLSRAEEMGNSQINSAFRQRNSDNNPKTFMDFLCQMEIKDANNKKDDSISSHDNYDYDSQLSSLLSEGISLVTPDVGNFNEILNNIDEKLKVISNVTENLCDLKKPDNININMNNNEDNHVKILLKPRSRVSSSSSAVSSEIFQPPERFSTPLNNVKIDKTFSAKLGINEQRAKVIISASESIQPDSKNGIEDKKVAITRNKFSSSSFDDKNVSEELINELSLKSSSESRKKASASDDKSEEKTGSSFPSYSTEKSNDTPISNELKSKSSQEQKDIITQSINFEIRTVKSQEFQGNMEKIDNNSASYKNNSKNSENSVISRSTKNNDNSENLSSGRDRTSNDISGLSSRILETLSNEKIETSIISPENQEKLEIKSLSPREIIPEKKNHELINENSKKTISMTSSLSSTCSKRSNGKKSTTDYSEGELFLPSSCAHSLGEIIPSNSNKIFVNLSNQASSQIATMITDGSSGEVLITDIDSNSSLT